MPIRRGRNLALLLLLGLLALTVLSLPVTLGFFFFGFLGPALLFYCLTGLGVSYIEQVYEPALDRRQTRRMLGGLLLVVAAYFLVEFDVIPPAVPYTPVREQVLQAFAVVPPLLPWLIRYLRHSAVVQSGRAVLWAMALAIALLLLGPMSRPLRSLFVLPPGFTGTVAIEVADDTCPPTPVRDSYRRFVIPPSGRLCAHPEAGWTMRYCTEARCSEGWDQDRWVYADDDSHPLSTWGERPAITQVRLGGHTQQSDRNGNLINQTQKLTFMVNPREHATRR